MLNRADRKADRFNRPADVFSYTRPTEKERRLAVIILCI